VAGGESRGGRTAGFCLDDGSGVAASGYGDGGGIGCGGGGGMGCEGRRHGLGRSQRYENDLTSGTRMEVRRAVGQGGVELSQIEWYKNDGVELIF